MKNEGIIELVMAMFIEFKKILDNGVSGAITAVLGEYILVYGGSNFENKYDRKVHDEYYIYDMEFNLINHGIGKIKPDNGVLVKDAANKIYYMLSNKVYEIYLDGIDLVENEILSVDENTSISFGVKYENRLIFGNDKVYEYDFSEKSLVRLSDFISSPRSQAVYTLSNEHIYLLGGASNVAYLETYRYDIKNNVWEKLKDLDFSLLGAASIKLDENNLLIMGGFDKTEYDKAVINLKDKGYKPIYFDRTRDSFNWNDKIIKYNLLNQTYEVKEISSLSRICGGVLIKKDENTYYLVMGELKPGLRSSYVYKYEVVK
ncbi:hypothetical protein [Oceanivirga miroungae]|uniref:N-acetylneuraminate epimerase n=1 Tax=Oceanivirga miroungae TaxID=1130046 RepID=A0A6I8MCD0_9FUSO|nr:hypothetical protein [Oceanivirga miroungae]VWL85121.1 N-acetylneuraminate epimerase [Oceanivirga miroungae]